MLKYLIVPLAENAVSYCHYGNDRTDNPDTISVDVLRDIILWAMKENLSVQFVYPETPVPEMIDELTDSLDHIKVKPLSVCRVGENDADIIVCDSFDMENAESGKIYVIRTSFQDFLISAAPLKALLAKADRVNVVFTDVEKFSKTDTETYRTFLQDIAGTLRSEYLRGHNVQLNLLTDRMMLSDMNNCEAGTESVAVSKDGSLYPCPGFISNAQFRCGSIYEGFGAPNLHLYKHENAPICNVCDAFHCKRCVWLGNKLTHEVNTPSWQQCVMAHIERGVSRDLLNDIRESAPDFLRRLEIPEIDYLDPFTKLYNL